MGFAHPGGELLLGRVTRIVLAEAGRATVEAGGPPPSPRFLHRARPGGRGDIPPSEHTGATSHFTDGKTEGSEGSTPCLRNLSQFIATSSAAQARRLPGIWASLLFAQMLDQVLRIPGKRERSTDISELKLGQWTVAP